MTMNETYTAASVSSRRLWFGVSGAMFAWAIHGLSSFVISDAACEWGHMAPWTELSRGGLRAVLIGITVAALVVSISAGLVSWRTWRTLATGDFEETQAPGRGEFMAMVGLFISTIFTIGILWGGLSAILTGLCEATR